MGNLLFLETANNFDDHGTAGLVIAGEHGRFIGADDVAFDDWLDAFTGNNGVHVRAHHDRIGARNRARETSDDFAGVAADCLSGVIDLHLRPYLFPVFLAALGAVALFARLT